MKGRRYTVSWDKTKMFPQMLVKEHHWGKKIVSGLFCMWLFLFGLGRLLVFFIIVGFFLMVIRSVALQDKCASRRLCFFGVRFY